MKARSGKLRAANRRAAGRSSLPSLGSCIPAATSTVTVLRTIWHLLFPQEVRNFSEPVFPMSHSQLTSNSEARPAPKPQPIGSFPFLLLITTATVCVVFILWRRSETLRTAVAHQCVQCAHPFMPFTCPLSAHQRSSGALRIYRNHPAFWCLHLSGIAAEDRPGPACNRPVKTTLPLSPKGF